MSDFDFFSAFIGIDILKAEAIANIVGKVAAAAFNSMTENGLSEDNAHKIINDTINVIAYQTLNSFK